MGFSANEISVSGVQSQSCRRYFLSYFGAFSGENPLFPMQILHLGSSSSDEIIANSVLREDETVHVGRERKFLEGNQFNEAFHSFRWGKGVKALTAKQGLCPFRNLDRRILFSLFRKKENTIMR